VLIYLEVKRRKKKRAMERYAIKRMRRKFKGVSRGGKGGKKKKTNIDWREYYDEGKGKKKKKKKKKKKGDGDKKKKKKKKKKEKKKKDKNVSRRNGFCLYFAHSFSACLSDKLPHTYPLSGSVLG
jgi:hypothetical protein